MMNPEELDILKFRIAGDDKTMRTAPPAKLGSAKHCNKEFIRGPLPLSWLCVAARLPGKALQVGLAIWFEYGRRKKDQFRLTTAILNRFGVARKAGYHGISALTKAGLISIQRQHGKNPVVTMQHHRGEGRREE